MRRKIAILSLVIKPIKTQWEKSPCCRSTSAKPAVRRSPQQSTSQIHQTGIRNFKDIPNSLMNYETYDFMHSNT